MVRVTVIASWVYRWAGGVSGRSSLWVAALWGTVVALSLAGVASGVPAGTRNLPSTAKALAAELESTKIAPSELNEVVTSAKANTSQNATTLKPLMTGAVAAVEIDATGPAAREAVFFFLYNNTGFLPFELGSQESLMRTGHGAKELGTVVGYPPTSSGAPESLVWDQPGTDAAGAPTAATFAGIIAPTSLTGANVGVIVEGVAVNPGSTPPFSGVAIELAKWGISHLGHVLQGAPASSSPAATPPSTSAATTTSAPAAGTPTRTFTGSGGTNLAPFTLPAGATLRWSDTGGLLSIFNNASNGPDPGVNTTARSGSSYLAPGSYQLQIITDASESWTITITSD